jgi:transposase
MPRPAAALALTQDQQSQIEQWLAAMGTPQQVALRCQIVLAAGRGESEAGIASALGVNRKTVRLWRERFAQEGLKGLWEIAAGRGRKATYGPERVKSDSRCDSAIEAEGSDALELPPHGGQSGHQQVNG